MRSLLHLQLTGTKPLLGGFDYFWKVILEKTTLDEPEFTYHEIDQACGPGRERLLRRFIERLQKVGFVEVAVERQSIRDKRVYRLVKRQRDTPVVSGSGGISQHGLAQQNMWNVMRREHHGFTVEHLRLAASTDDLNISLQTAKDYCRRLAKADVLHIETRGERGVGRNCYVLRGSRNTGPKAPIRYRVEFIFDPNTGIILGNDVAQEVAR